MILNATTRRSSGDIHHSPSFQICRENPKAGMRYQTWLSCFFFFVCFQFANSAKKEKKMGFCGAHKHLCDFEHREDDAILSSHLLPSIQRMSIFLDFSNIIYGPALSYSSNSPSTVAPVGHFASYTSYCPID